MREFSGYQKGINFGGWFSQCEHTRAHYDTFRTQADFERVAQWGLDHVRLPFDYNLLEDADGTSNSFGMSYLQNVVDWCGACHLNLILDLHKTAGYSFDVGERESGFFEDAALQERFYRLWERVAERFGIYADRVAFELLNEVTDRAFCDRWNAIAAACVARIRQAAPETKILIGGYWNNSVAAVPDLPMPFDANIVYNFHCYEPLVFTHQGAYWVPNMPADFRTTYPQTAGAYQHIAAEYGLECAALSNAELQGKDYFQALFAEAVAVAQERNVPLYCGEYGVISLADAESIVAWHQAIHAAFEAYGIGRAVWCYKAMDFGLIDANRADSFAAVQQLL